MSKWQIICPLVAMAIAAIVAALAIAAPMNRGSARQRLLGLGVELATTTNSSRLQHIDLELKQRLTELLASPSGVAAVALGDEPPPLGDGTATGRLFLTNANGQRLGIRVHRNSTGDDFRVLGSWMTTTN